MALQPKTLGGRAMPVSEIRTKIKFTPPELGELWGVSADKILGWIRDGSLRAVNIAARLGGRPRWMIDAADVASFEAARSNRTAPKRNGRQRRQQAGGFTRFRY